MITLDTCLERKKVLYFYFGGCGGLERIGFKWKTCLNSNGSANMTVGAMWVLRMINVILLDRCQGHLM